MIINLSKIEMKERPILLLKNANNQIIAPLNSALNIKGQIYYNEVSTLSFDIPKMYDGIAVEGYDEIQGMRIVEWKDIAQFVLVNPVTVNDGIVEKKQCKMYSLDYEFTYKKISLENATYNFWNPVTPDSTILGIILSYMPSWSVGTVDTRLIGKYRTFEIDNENLYDFMKSTLQDTYSCVFEFDTLHRKVNVRDANQEPNKKAVFLSTDNLVKEIEIEEDTESIITVLDVNGADGVTIRSVNPMGTNKIYNLDYFMNTTNFSQSIIDRWNEWKKTYKTNQELYYNVSLNQSSQIARYNTELADLVDMQGELSNLESQQAVIIQAVSQGLSSKNDLTDINYKISTQKNTINTQQALLEDIQGVINSITEQLKEINGSTSFSTFFTEDEIILLDRYFKEDAITDSSFVAATTETYTDSDVYSNLSSCGVSITGAEISSTKYSNTKTFYSIRGGHIRISHTDFDIDAEIIRATFEHNSNNSVVFSCYLDDGTLDDQSFASGSLSFCGTSQSLTSNGSSLSATLSPAKMYFTKNVTDYEQRQIEWDLYEYGEEQLNRLSSPTYSFKLSSQNFLALDSYRDFTNQIALGEKVYVETTKGIITPIVVGVTLDFESIEALELEFGSTFDINNGTFSLVDLVSQSVSMGKSVDFNKYNYNKFIDSGAESSVRNFMSSALDVAKNAILSSSGQAISWDGAGLRLRKWLNEEEGTYDPRQIWMANNSIMFTQDNWESAVIGIGEFTDKNLGTCYGIVTPNLFGTLLAGENLIIESVKEDGGTSVFRVDGDGAFLHNADFNIVSNGTQITLNADQGIGIGKYPLYATDSNGNEVINETNAKFWVDKNGNVHIKGILEGASGTFSGELKAATGSFAGTISGGSINIGNGNFVVDSNGNLTAKNGTFSGVIQGATYKDSLGNNMMNANEQFKAGYLSLYGLNITNGSQTTLSIDSSGNVRLMGNITLAAGSSINWANITETNLSSSATYALANSASSTANEAYNLADDAYYEALDAYDLAYDNRNTARNIFDVLTNNGSYFGIFSDSATSKLYINAEYIRSGYIDAGEVFLENGYGGFKVARGHDGVRTTYGALMYGGDESNYFIATNAGVRMTYDDDVSIYCISSGVYSTDEVKTTSDARLKNSISYDIDKYEGFFMSLKPCYFRFNNKGDTYHTGFIAQEVKQALLDNGLTDEDFSGFSIAESQDGDIRDKNVLSYTSFVSLNTHMIQKLVDKVKTLENKILELEEGKIND